MMTDPKKDTLPWRIAEWCGMFAAFVLIAAVVLVAVILAFALVIIVAGWAF